MEQLDYNLLFRWFVGLSMDAPVWDVTVFTKNRERLLAGDVAAKFMAAVLSQPRVKTLLSDEHFSVDGTLIDAWASMKSFRPKDGSGEPPGPGRNGERSFHGEKRSNETHASTTDPDALLARKGGGKEAKLSFSGHVMMENRNGLCVDISVAQATGTAERDEALMPLGRLQDRGFRPRTLGGDKGYDVATFVHTVRAAGVTPHVAQNTSGRRSNFAARGLLREPEDPKTRRGNLRLGQDGRRPQTDALPGSRANRLLGLHRRCHLQLVSDVETDALDGRTRLRERRAALTRSPSVPPLNRPGFFGDSGRLMVDSNQHRQFSSVVSSCSSERRYPAAVRSRRTASLWPAEIVAYSPLSVVTARSA